MVLRHVHDQVNLVVGNEVHYLYGSLLADLLIGPSHSRSLHVVVVQVASCATGGIDCQPLSHKHLGGFEHVDLAFGTTRRDEDALLRQAIARGDEGIEQGFVERIAQTAHLTSRGHVDTEHGIGILQTCKRELRGLHADAVDVELVLVGTRIGHAKHDLRGGLDEVALQDLRHKRERTRCAQVALDDLYLAVLGQILDVERSADVQFLGNLARDFLDLANGREVDVLGREYHRGVARVHTGILNMLRNGVFHNFALVGNGIELNLLGVLHELRHHDGVVLRHFCGHVEEAMQLLIVVADVHGSTREHVAGTHQHGITHLADELLDVVERGQGTPTRLVDAEFVEHGRELVAVFSAVDVDGTCAEHGHMLPVELHGEVIRNLSAHADDDAARFFDVDDVEHALQRQFIEVEAVAHVVVGRHGFGVIVDHHALITLSAGGLDGVYRTPVELNA